MAQFPWRSFETGETRPSLTHFMCGTVTSPAPERVLLFYNQDQVVGKVHGPLGSEPCGILYLAQGVDTPISRVEGDQGYSKKTFSIMWGKIEWSQKENIIETLGIGGSSCSMGRAPFKPRFHI